VLVRGRLVVPVLAVFGALIPVFVWGGAAALGSGFGLGVEATGLPFFPMSVATLFGIVAGSLAAGRRRAPATPAAAGAARGDAAASPQGWRFLAALTLGGLLVSGLTTPALAATEAGVHAVPHGSHSIPGLPALPGGHSHSGH
jgi:hypothetical protein